MTTKFLLIDDDVESSEAPAERYAEKLSAVSAGDLTVDTHRPGSIDKVLEHIAATKPDGILIDLDFSHALTEDHAPLRYDGMALAQQIRTNQTRGLRQSGGSNLPEFPLVRLSKIDVVREFVKGDTTSDDLFDEKVDKGNVVEHAESIAQRLISLSVDYPVVSDFASKEEKIDQAIAVLLGVPEEFLSHLDPRALLGLRRRDAPAHVISRYVIGALLGRPGPLIPNSLLAIRLGVDCQKSEDWFNLLKLLHGEEYQGAFASGYHRWWMDMLLNWWAQEIDAERPPFRLSSAERVQVIQQKTGLDKLAPIEETQDSPGTKFWHRCIASSRPVDPTHGFPLMPEWGQENWHDVDYLCREEALRDSRNPRLAASERSRILKLQKGQAQ
jgi:hypothetical protein